MSTPEDIIAREMQRRVSTSIFDSRGVLKADEARERASNGNVSLGEYLHLAGVEWAAEPDGSEHCAHLARLTEYMAELPPSWGGVVAGPLDQFERKVLHAVAMLYCTGRAKGDKSFGVPSGDERAALIARGGGTIGAGYEARSAKLAEEFFRQGGGDGTYWGKVEVREEVCRLIYKHNDPREIAADPRLQIFEDARRYETVRYWQNTAEGLAMMKERCKPEMFWLGWSKSKENFRAHMVARGWK